MAVRRRRILFALVLIVLALVWRVAVAPRWTDRVPRGWSMTTRFAGVQTNADPVTGLVAEHDDLGVYDRSIVVASDSARPRAVRVRDALVSRDPRTGRVTWQYIIDEMVDPTTGARAEPQYRGDVALFPRETQKHVYRLRSNYVKGLPLRFQREEEVAGLATYLFSYRGRGEYAETFAGSAEFPGVKLDAGQELRCADDQFYLNMWVEPMTGEAVKVDEGCRSGDFVYDLASGRPVAAVDRWYGLASGTALLERVGRVQTERLEYLAAGRAVPIALALAGVGLMVASLHTADRREARA